MRIELPFPNGKISPNRAKGVHWGATSSLKGRQFDDAFMLTMQLTGGVKRPDKEMPMKVVFCEPDRRKRDLDNCLAAAKSAIDGIASALGVNDKNFSPITIIRGVVVKGGLMVVEVY